MNFTSGLLNLTNWLGNVIMPTMAGLFAAAAICEATATMRPSSTRATVSMPASGVSRIVRSEVYTRTIVYTRVSQDGRNSNQH